MSESAPSAAHNGPAYSIDARTFFTSQRPSREQRAAEGVERRQQVPLASLGDVPSADLRRDALAILHAQDVEGKLFLCNPAGDELDEVFPAFFVLDGSGLLMDRSRCFVFNYHRRLLSWLLTRA